VQEVFSTFSLSTFLLSTFLFLTFLSSMFLPSTLFQWITYRRSLVVHQRLPIINYKSEPIYDLYLEPDSRCDTLKMCIIWAWIIYSEFLWPDKEVITVHTIRNGSVLKATFRAVYLDMGLDPHLYASATDGRWLVLSNSNLKFV